MNNSAPTNARLQYSYWQLTELRHGEEAKLVGIVPFAIKNLRIRATPNLAIVSTQIAGEDEVFHDPKRAQPDVVQLPYVAGARTLTINVLCTGRKQPGSQVAMAYESAIGR